jgi:chemotaxis protein CheC
MIAPILLEERQLDALREVANIGAGHAATALSQMIDACVLISVPKLSIAKLADMPPVVEEPEEPVAAVLLNMMGDLTGRTLLVFPRKVASRLCELLLNKEPGSTVDFGKLEQSAINEVGNILSSAYINALSSFMGMMLLPTPPKLSVESSSNVMTPERLQLVSGNEHVLCVESEFLIQGKEEVGRSQERLRGFFLLLPDPSSLNAILKAVHLD